MESRKHKWWAPSFWESTSSIFIGSEKIKFSFKKRYFSDISWALEEKVDKSFPRRYFNWKGHAGQYCRSDRTHLSSECVCVWEGGGYLQICYRIQNRECKRVSFLWYIVLLKLVAVDGLKCSNSLAFFLLYLRQQPDMSTQLALK